MAIIKCPECGNPVSDKAPYCPKCGIEIAGKIKSQSMTPPPVPPAEKLSNSQSPKDENKKNGTRNVLIVCLVIALIACGLALYFYHDAQSSKEQSEYEYAMKSTDPAVLQAYLDTFTDAPEAHIDSIQAHLLMLQQGDKDWSNALVSNSKSAFESYIANHPDSPHKAEAEHKIDSIDWATVSTTNTVDAYNTYLQDHPNGEHVDEAKDGIKQVNAKTVQPEEKQMISSLFRQFFQSVNTRDEIVLTNTCESLMTSFLGKPDATKSDVVTFLDKIWKDDVTNMTWRINNDYTISKKEVGDDDYEYTVQFSAVQSKTTEESSKPTNTLFRINAKVSPNDKISSFSMVKIIE